MTPGVSDCSIVRTYTPPYFHADALGINTNMEKEYPYNKDFTACKCMPVYLDDRPPIDKLNMNKYFDSALESLYYSIAEANQKRYEEYKSLTPEEKGKLDIWIDSLGQIGFKCQVLPVFNKPQKEGNMSDVVFKDLEGKILLGIEGKVGDEEITFTTNTGERYIMYHEQDCSESVTVEDICGDLNDLISTPILLAEETTSDYNPEGVVKECQDSFTWTFYHLRTKKGTVTIRWYGESNGYYSEQVDFRKE